MAQIVERKSKNGQVSYLIRASAGYGIDGKQIKHSMTWIPPEGMTPAKIKKAVQVAAMEFERDISVGSIVDGSVRFCDFAKKYMDEYATKQLKAKTVDTYGRELEVINQAIGHIRLRDLRTGHINSFYANLQEEGVRRDGRCKAKKDIAATLEKKKLTKVKLSELSGVSVRTLSSAFAGENVSWATAEKIATALGCKRTSLFADLDGGTLDANTVRTYHRCLSSVLSKAVKWGYIPFNPATNAELPKMSKKEASHLDEADARLLLVLLQDEPIYYRAPITFDLLSGLRRGELLGLRWSDVDFDNQMIHIVQTSAYLRGKGVYTDTPKNESSARPLKLSRSAFVILEEMRTWQNQQRELCGDFWKDTDGRVFTREDGAPLRPDTLTGWFHDFVQRNGLPDVHVHSLRHTYASLMIADKTPLVIVAKRMGHSQTSTTANIYAHMIQSADEKAAEVVELFADVISNPAQEKKVTTA
ncbi:MAG: tyrosine-type recombinase/integrase [Faecousia sp.]